MTRVVSAFDQQEVRRTTSENLSERPWVDVVVPVYNEAHVLDLNITRLHDYLHDHFPFSWRITIADNASTDDTWAVAQALHRRLPRVSTLHLEQKGRGRALKAAWLASDAIVVAYMDVDLSTDLDGLLPLTAPLLSGHSDVSIGSRLARGSRVVRGPKRELISRTYNRILRVILGTQFRDAQCGFKAVRADIAQSLLPTIEDNGWFFDTELLVNAERHGLRIAELPVDWIDDPDSRVDIVHTAIEDLRGVWRLARTFWFRSEPGNVDQVASRPRPLGSSAELVSFAKVGAGCTVLYLTGLFALQGPVGPYWANAIALTGTMVLNTAANRRYTFGRRGARGRGREYMRALGVHCVGLAITTAALVVLRSVVPDVNVVIEAVVMTLASMAASALRFVLMPAWVFRNQSTEGTGNER